jgi:hypothetical protein
MDTAQGIAQCSGQAFALATTANGSVVLAPHQAFGIFVVTNAEQDNAAADLVRDTLLAAGWTLKTNIQAVGYITAPFGWGYTGLYGNVVTITYPPLLYYAVFVFYDPLTQQIPTGVNVVPVVAGSTSALSQANLILAIGQVAPGSPNSLESIGAVVVAAANGPDQIILTAVPVGTLGNSITVAGNDSNSLGQAPSGGGWELSSRSQAQVFGAGNTAQILITATTGADSNLLQLSATIAGVTVDMAPEIGGWFLIADDFQAFFFTGSGGPSSFFWASSLCIPPSIPLSFAAFILQANGDTGSDPTLGTPNSALVNSFVEGIHTVVANVGQQSFSIGMYHAEGSGAMVVDPTGTAVLQTPWVFLPCGYNSESRICGQLFDCLACSGPNPFTQQFTVAGYNYRVIASQTSPPGSLLMSTGEVANTGTASSSNPPTPSPTHPAPPSSAVGSGDVSDQSPYVGQMAIISSTSVPDSSWVGLTIIIGLAAGPTSFTITGASAGELTFTPAPIPPIAGGITYNAPFSLSV